MVVHCSMKTVASIHRRINLRHCRLTRSIAKNNNSETTSSSSSTFPSSASGEQRGPPQEPPAQDPPPYIAESTMSSISNSNNSGITTSTHPKLASGPGHKSSSSLSPRLSSSSSSSSAHPAVNSACAACKYQRRKCKPDCTLAPYFPANKQQSFLNAHRLFGVSNIVRIISDLDPIQRNEAMQTIIFQSDMRAHDPVGGCYSYIQHLERQIKHETAELSIVLRQLAIFRQQAAATQTMPNVSSPDLDPNHAQFLLNPPTDEAENLIYDGCNGFFPMMNNPGTGHHQDQQQYFNYFYEGGPNGSINRNITVSNSNSNDNHSNSDTLGLHHYQQQQQHLNNCLVEVGEDVKPLVDMFEVRALIGVDDEGDSKNVTNGDVGYLQHSLSLELIKDDSSTEHVQEHDLKSAASLFTLTNCSF